LRRWAGETSVNKGESKADFWTFATFKGNWMVKRWLFLIIGLLILPCLARADDFTLSGNTEGG